MNYYINEAFARTNLQYIREFILSGEQLIQPKDESYHVRLKEGTDPICDRLKNLYPVEDEYEEAYTDLNMALSTHENVYMELGMKIGARLVYQLLVSAE